MANTLLLKIVGDPGDARRSLREIAAEVQAFGRQKAAANVDINAREARRELRDLDRALTVVGSRDVTAKVKVKIEEHRSKLKALRSELDLALSGGKGARDVGSITADITKLGSSIGQLGATGLQGVLAPLSELPSKAGGAILGLAGNIATLIPTILAAVAAGGLLVTALSAIIGVAVALAGSLAFAVAGFGALAVAAGALLLPALGALVAIVARVGGAFKALQDRQANAKQNADQLASAEQQHTSALRAAADARRQAGQAMVDAYRAQRDAAVEVKDSELALENARLGRTDANLRLERAKQNLKDLKGTAGDLGSQFDKLSNQITDTQRLGPNKVAALERRIGGLSTKGGGATDLDAKEALQEVLRARLGVKQAKQDEVRATNTLADAQAKENEFARKGIAAYEPYAQAVRAAADAERQAAKAGRDVGDVRAKQNEDLKKYSKDEVGAAKALKGLFDQAVAVFQKAAKPALQGLTSLIGDIADLLKDPGISGGVTKIGEAFGDVFKAIGAFTRERRTRAIIADLLGVSSKLVRVLGSRVFTSFLRILLTVAQTAARPLLGYMRGIARALEGLGTGRGPQHVRDFVEKAIKSFRIWGGLIKAVGRVLAAVFGDGRDIGNKLVRTVTRLVNEFADFLNRDGGREKFQAWLRQSVRRVGQMVKGVVDLIGFLGKVGEAAIDIYDFFKPIFPLVEKIAKAIERAVKAAAGLAGYVSGADPVLEAKNQTQGVATAKSAIAREKDPARKEALRQQFSGLYPGVKFARGGIVTRALRGIVGEAGPEAVLPLRQEVFRQLAAPIGVALASSPALAGAALGGRGGDTISNQFDIHVAAPAGQTPDARAAAVALARELSRRGAGGLR